MPRYLFAFLVGLTIALGDIPVHYLLVSPMETPLYFVMLFIFGFIVAAIFSKSSVWKGSILGAVIFTLVKSAWYYLAYLTDNPTISSCVLPPSYNCTIAGVPTTIFGYLGGYPVTAVTIFEGVIHTILFFVAFLLWREILD